MKAERGKIQHSCFIQTEKKLSSSCLVVSTHTLGPLHLRRGRGGGGHFQHATRTASGVTERSWFCLLINAGSDLVQSELPLALDPVYRVSPASHTKRSVSAGTWYRRLYFSPVGKHLPVKTGTCRSSGGSDLHLMPALSLILASMTIFMYVTLQTSIILPQQQYCQFSRCTHAHTYARTHTHTHTHTHTYPHPTPLFQTIHLFTANHFNVSLIY